MARTAASAQALPVHSKGRDLWREIKKHRFYFLVFLPVFAFFIIFSYTPMYGLTLAFKDFNISQGILGSPWSTPLFKTFQRVFSSALFQRALWNTIFISLLKLVVAFPIPIIFAILLDELPGRKFKKTVQTVSYLPYFISWVVLGGIIRTLLSPSIGAVNFMIESLGGSAVNFLGEAGLFRGIIFFTYVWQSVGYGAVVYLAAITGIDQEQYEAARIDGANRFQLIRHITLPSIRSVIVIMLILNMGSVMSAGFDQVFNLYSPVTYSTGDIIDTYVYRVGIVDMQYSYSTAVGLFKNVIGLGLALITNFAAKRIDPDSALF